MFHIDRIRSLSCYLLLAGIAGCSGNAAVTISAAHFDKSNANEIKIGSTATMTSDKVGALVSVGGSSGDMITTTIAEIADDKVVLDISHPGFESKRVDIKLGESTDMFFGDGRCGVRLQFAEAE